jgi:cytochrome P450
MTAMTSTITISHQPGPSGQPAACWQPGPPAWAAVPGSQTGARVLLLRRHAHVRAALIGDGRLRNLAEVPAGHALAGVTLQAPGGLLRLAPPRTAIREPLNRAWRPAPAAQCRPALRHAAAGLARGLARQGEGADLIGGFCVPLTDAVTGLATGLGPEQVQELRRLSDATTGALLTSPASHGRARAAWGELYEVTGPAVAALRARPDGTLLAESVSALDTAGLTAGQAHEAAATIYNGLPTVLPVLARVLDWLLARPAVLAACHSDPALIPRAVTAALRQAAHFTFALPGIATATVHVDQELTVDAGTVVLPVIHAAQADRTRGPGLAWGAGVHACLGRHLATEALTAAVAAVAAELPGWQAAPAAAAWQPGTIPMPARLLLTPGPAATRT